MEIAIALLAAVLLYLLQRYLYSFYWDKGLSVELKLSTSHCMEGEDAYLTQIITNQKMLPIPILRIKYQTS